MPKPRLPAVITTRTDAEWPADHPARRGATVLPNRVLANMTAYLICTIEGEQRDAPVADDQDVIAACQLCSVSILHRASAPDHAIPICWKCWVDVVNG